jgi:hypothetical protein
VELAVALQHSGIQIQAVAFRSQRQALHLPFRQRLVQALHVPHAELSKQIADGVIDRKPLDSQQGMQRLVTAQQGRMSKAFAAHQDRRQEGHEGGGRLNLVG